MEYFKLMTLPYAPNALEPIISSETIAFHHGKHLAGYVNNLNALLPGTQWEELTIEEMVKQLSEGASVKTKTGTRIRQKGSNLSADYNQLREGLRNIFKTRVEMTCSESGKGKISIPFNGEAELERIIEMLDKLREV